MRSFPCFARNLLAATMLTAVAAAPLSASAEEFENYFFFGDSLTDTGNLFEAIGIPPSPPYFNGHFSNGPVWSAILVPDLALGPTSPTSPNLNLAFGGAETGTDPLPPGVLFQVGIMQAIIAGGANSIDENDLISIWAGANNYFRVLAIIGGGGLFIPELIMLEVATVNAQLGGAIEALYGMGARTFLVGNLPDLGRTPAFGPTPLAGVATSITDQHNAALAEMIEGLKATLPGVNIITLDANGLIELVVADPARFGFTNVTTPCFNEITFAVCSADEAATSLFWDGVHPTTAAHAIIAQVARALLNADEAVMIAGAQSETGLIMARAMGRDVQNRLRQIRAGVGAFSMTGGAMSMAPSYDQYGRQFAAATQNSELLGFSGGTTNSGGVGFRAYVGGSMTYANRSGDFRPLAFDADLSSLTVGIDYQISEGFVVGVAGGFSNGEVEFADGVSEFDIDGKQVTLYGTYFRDSFYLDATVGFGDLDIDDVVRRTGVIGITALGDTTGNVVTASANAGYLIREGSAVFGPVVGLRYINVEVDAYDEVDAPIVGIAQGEQEITSLVAEFGIQAMARYSAGFADFIPHAAVTYELELDGSRELAGAIMNNSANPIAIGDKLFKDDVLNLNIGFIADFGNGFEAAVSYNNRMGVAGGDEAIVSAQISYRF